MGTDQTGGCLELIQVCWLPISFLGFSYAHAQLLTRLRSTVHYRIYPFFFIFDLDLRVKVTQNIAQYLLHHVTYAPAKFEVAMSNSLGGDKFTRKYII